MTDATRSNTANFLLELGTYDEDDLKVMRFELDEGISELFELRVELASRDSALDFGAILGQPAIFTMRGPDGDRYLHGVATEFEQGGASSGHFFYEVTIRPRFWLLGQRSNCRIFQGDNVSTIVTKLLEEHGLANGQDFDISLSFTPLTLEYCVQYQESDLDFVKRLLEQEGIYFYFVSDAEHSTLYLRDQSDENVTIAGDPELRHAAQGGMVSEEDTEQVFDLRYSLRVLTNQYATRDYDFKAPQEEVGSSIIEFSAEEAGEGAKPLPALEVFDYPGGDRESAADNLAAVRLEALRARYQEARGKSNSTRFFAGARFELVEHPRPQFNVGYLLVSVHHEGSNAQALEEDTPTGGEAMYANTFVAIPESTPYRPARVTPRPLIHGTHTATVTGPDNEEIYTDEYGRIKVRFHWDRADSADQDSSCWMRVKHFWAGPGFGHIAIPRIGWEVAIAFEDGDPDCPHVLGPTYNADNMPPNTLPDQKSKMTIRSRSLGGGTGFNELTFDDADGSEEVYVHAQKDMNTMVLNNRCDETKENATTTVGKNKKTSVGVNETHTVGSNRTTSVGADDKLTVTKNSTAEIGGDDTHHVTGNQTCSVGKKREETVGGNLEIIVGGTATLWSDGNLVAGSNKALRIQSSKDMDLESEAKITLTVGGSKVEITSNGIKITSSGTVAVKGSTITLN